MTASLVQIIGKLLHSWPKIFIHDKPYIDKSTRFGVTLCFQFASVAAAATKTFASHVKTVCAKPYIFETKVWGNVPDYLSVTLTQGHGCDID